MVDISNKRLDELKKSFDGKRIAVVGDMMLDGYYWGDVKRISPEAPVPVLEVEDEFFRFGGAANVAYNILTLGGIPVPVGVIGNDTYGQIFSSLIKEKKIEDEGIIIDNERPTTTKTRIIADNQHIVRIDKESKAYISSKIEEKISIFLASTIDNLDGIILQDYNKGVLTPSLISKIISIANKKNILITVDPKFDNFFEYKNVTVFKPNRKETETVLGTRIKDDEDISSAGRNLLHKLNSKYVLLTLGEGGIAVFEKDDKERRMPTKARKVADVSGAGDTVISTLTIGLAAGADIYEACYLANYAAGVVCGEVGIVPIEKGRLFDTILKDKE
ncbi:MAG: D-glycero-beta-D-manno-heptose-7-phosphate kinase [Ignavibacteriaceae bacterium]|nr:D-glycero-beta-D-manno-heptose-7-phosphate kinase [Ignavibacteriaceae bacterium]MCW9065369.1 D-glycero-beta-D-manno-heptose-7-phosphate kinase [Ignavibacteriaceae bacterium]